MFLDIPNIKDLHMVERFQIFQAKTNYVMVSSNYFRLFVVICLHIVYSFKWIIVMFSEQLYIRVTIKDIIY